MLGSPDYCLAPWPKVCRLASLDGGDVASQIPFHDFVVSYPDPTDTDTFFAIMRLLLPESDRARPAYGMKETALAKHYIEVLNISKESTDAQKEAGDFAVIAYFVLKSRCGEYLDDLANGNTSKDRAGMKKALQLLLRNTSALEQKWLIRIILKGLKTGLSENSVFSVFHPDAVDLFSICSNLEKVGQWALIKEKLDG
eukprot:Em0004g218a